MSFEDLATTIKKRFGYDASQFSPEFAEPRLRDLLRASPGRQKKEDLSLDGAPHLARGDVIQALSVPVTTMFRDALFYRDLREKVLSALLKKDHVFIWDVGCATGEEAYSLAIFLEEMGFHGRYTLYATDFNRWAIAQAKRGTYDIRNAQRFTHSYHRAGGGACFSDYYHAGNEALVLDRSLRDQITFAEHDLFTDQSFTRPDIVLCRNVMIYFSRQLQIATINLLTDCLENDGFFCVGKGEPIVKGTNGQRLEEISKEGRIFRLKSQDSCGSDRQSARISDPNSPNNRMQAEETDDRDGKSVHTNR